MKTWKNLAGPELKKEYFLNLEHFLKNERQNNKKIFPSEENIYRALKTTPLEKVKVVILGQDPYHGEGQAHGLCFSVPEGVAHPPSLKNIFKELHTDIGCKIPVSGDLTAWAQQGVLLLNSVLTVEESKAASHQNKGWEIFTDKLIQIVDEQCEHVVFILWGSYAQKKAAFVNKNKHCVIMNVHPSPLSVHRGFYGSKPFSKANEWLKTKGLSPIKWDL